MTDEDCFGVEDVFNKARLDVGEGGGDRVKHLFGDARESFRDISLDH